MGGRLFGQYLKDLGLVTDDDVFRARMLQKNHNRRLGELAVRREMLTEDEVERVLVVQEEAMKRFGEVAVFMGYLGQDELESLLGEMKDGYLFIGEALVKLGAVSRDKMLEGLQEYFRLLAEEDEEGGSGGEEDEEQGGFGGQNLELAIRRLAATGCAETSSCGFYLKWRTGGRKEASLDILRYCIGEPGECARNIVRKELGTGGVPEDMAPGEKRRAVELIREAGRVDLP